MIRYDPEIHDALIRHLFRCQLSDEQIGERLGMKTPIIERNRQRLGLGLPKGRRPKQPREKDDDQRLLGPDPTSPIQIAKMTLGHRLTERNGTYILDRTPISAPDMVREANRVRVSKGLEQIGHSDWRVKP